MNSRDIHEYSSSSQKCCFTQKCEREAFEISLFPTRPSTRSLVTIRIRSIRITDRRDALPGHRRYQEQRPVHAQHARPHPLLLRGAGVVVRRIRSGFLFHTSSLLNARDTVLQSTTSDVDDDDTTTIASLRTRLPPLPPSLPSPRKSDVVIEKLPAPNGIAGRPSGEAEAGAVERNFNGAGRWERDANRRGLLSARV